VAVVAALREVLPRLFVQFSPALSTGAASPPVLAHGSSSSHLTAPEDMAPVTEYAAYATVSPIFNSTASIITMLSVELMSSVPKRIKNSMVCIAVETIYG
jgi:hypothetical protein